jgi:hypothetical protein
VAKISVQQLLQVLAAFDEHGGASPGLVAWELFVDERDVQPAWEHAIAEDWLKPAGRDPAGDEPLYRLTLDGWAAARKSFPRLKAVPETGERFL